MATYRNDDDVGVFEAVIAAFFDLSMIAICCVFEKFSWTNRACKRIDDLDAALDQRVKK
jgi:hypothetical protein